MAYTAIDNPELYFQVKLYTGTGSSLSVTLDGDEDMQPDMIWIKARNAVENHAVFDAVRGATKYVKPDETAAEVTDTNSLSAFNSDGFTVVSDGKTNTSARTYVAFCWKAGTSFTNDASATGVASIDSTGSVNTDAGISIMSFVGTESAATVAHGLSAVPSMIITKNRSIVNSWGVYHASLGATKYLRLQENYAVATESGWWNDTTPTSALYSVADVDATNGSSENMIAYLFAPKQGFSKFGSYDGNGNADGTFVYTGFRPAMVIFKDIDGTNSWRIGDTKRIDAQGGNGQGIYSFPNTSAVEQDATTRACDYLSNGFKIRHNDGSMNGDGVTYIYMAWAEAPFVNSNGVPCNAR